MGIGSIVDPRGRLDPRRAAAKRPSPAGRFIRAPLRGARFGVAVQRAAHAPLPDALREQRRCGLLGRWGWSGSEGVGGISTLGAVPPHAPELLLWPLASHGLRRSPSRALAAGAVVAAVAALGPLWRLLWRCAGVG